MATCLKVPNLRTGYVKVCRTVLEEGKPTSPRGQLTHEVQDFIIEVADPTDVLPIGVGRSLNSSIAAAEALQLIGGLSKPGILTRINSNFEQFMDGNRFWAAYGDRTRRGGIHQAEDVVHKLTVDPDSRQAVITLWNPLKDNVPGKHDYPCTLSLVFTIRQGLLNCSVTMRSNDVWWGLAYDAFQFTQLQMSIANALGIIPGTYTHHAISMHAYARDFDGIENLHEPLTAFRPALPLGIDVLPGQPVRWSIIENQARAILTGEGSGQHPWWNKFIGEYVR